MRRAYLWPGLSCWLVVLSAASLPAASLRLPAVIGDNMVLQRDKAVPIWGWADKGEKVTVALAGQSVEATADDRGRWKVTLDKLEKAGPLEMTVKTASSSLTVKNILVGEVWVCSGQSNMEMGIGACRNAKEEIAAADYPQIRLFTVAKVRAAQPARDVKGHWAECSPKTVSADGWGGFSAAAYYFGRTLHKELKVPVGLIHTSWGGTAAEEWTSKKAFQSEPKLKGLGGFSALQRHDRSADSFCHPWRHLVPGRGQRGPGLPVSYAAAHDDSQLAKRLGRGRFPLLPRANCSFPL